MTFPFINKARKPAKGSCLLPAWATRWHLRQGEERATAPRGHHPHPGSCLRTPLANCCEVSCCWAWHTLHLGRARLLPSLAIAPGQQHSKRVEDGGWEAAV